jgi:hypothetical protein
MRTVRGLDTRRGNHEASCSCDVFPVADDVIGTPNVMRPKIVEARIIHEPEEEENTNEHTKQR